MSEFRKPCINLLYPRRQENGVGAPALSMIVRSLQSMRATSSKWYDLYTYSNMYYIPCANPEEMLSQCLKRKKIRCLMMIKNNKGEVFWLYEFQKVSLVFKNLSLNISDIVQGLGMWLIQVALLLRRLDFLCIYMQASPLWH